MDYKEFQQIKDDIYECITDPLVNIMERENGILRDIFKDNSRIKYQERIEQHLFNSLNGIKIDLHRRHLVNYVLELVEYYLYVSEFKLREKEGNGISGISDIKYKNQLYLNISMREIWKTLYYYSDVNDFQKRSRFEYVIEVEESFDEEGYIALKGDKLKHEEPNSMPELFIGKTDYYLRLYMYLFNELSKKEKTKASLLYHYFKDKHYLSSMCTQKSYIDWINEKLKVKISKIFPKNYSSQDIINDILPRFEEVFKNRNKMK